MYHYQHSWPDFADTLSRVKTHWLPCFPTCFPPAIVHCVPHSIGYRHLICHYRLSLYWQTSLMLLSSPFPIATTDFPLPSKPHAPLSSLSPMSIIWDPPPQSSTYVANTPFTIFTTQVATISRSTTVGILPFCHTPWALSSYPLANAYHCQIHHHHLPFPLKPPNFHFPPLKCLSWTYCHNRLSSRTIAFLCQHITVIFAMTFYISTFLANILVHFPPLRWLRLLDPSPSSSTFSSNLRHITVFHLSNNYIVAKFI